MQLYLVRCFIVWHLLCVVCVYHLALALYYAMTNHFCVIVLFEYPCVVNHRLTKIDNTIK